MAQVRSYTAFAVVYTLKRPKKYAQIFQTQKNTRLNLQPKKIQELKILDPKKYVGPSPSRLYPSTPPGAIQSMKSINEKRKGRQRETSKQYVRLVSYQFISPRPSSLYLLFSTKQTNLYSVSNKEYHFPNILLQHRVSPVCGLLNRPW